MSVVAILLLYDFNHYFCVLIIIVSESQFNTNIIQICRWKMTTKFNGTYIEKVVDINY